MLIDTKHNSNYLVISNFFCAEHRIANNFIDCKLYSYQMNIIKCAMYKLKF